MAKKKEAKLGGRSGSGVTDDMAREAGAAPKVIEGVSKLSNGHLKMVGVKHGERVGMLVPEALKSAWREERMAQGYSSDTECFEDVMLRWLYQNGWKLDGVESPGGE